MIAVSIVAIAMHIVRKQTMLEGALRHAQSVGVTPTDTGYVRKQTMLEGALRPASMSCSSVG